MGRNTSKQFPFRLAPAVTLVIIGHLFLNGNLLGQDVSPLTSAGVSDYLLLSGTIASRSLDWVTTQECIRNPACKEMELPKSLAASKAGLAIFETGMTALTWYGARELCKHGHTKLARYSQSLSIGETFIVDVHNLSLADKVHRQR